MKRLTIEIDEKLKAKAKAESYREGLTLKDKLTKLVLDWLRKKKVDCNE